MSNTYSCQALCGACGYVDVIPNTWDGLTPCGGSCPKCGAYLFWKPEDVYLASCVPSNVAEGEAPEATVVIEAKERQ